jgi:ATP-binding cassette subfamily F protein uup
VIYELDDNQIFRYKGNYSYFLEKREARINNTNIEINKARSLFKKEQDWINRSPSARTTKAKYRIDSFYETKEIAQKKIQNDSMQINVQSARLGKKVIELYNITKAFDDKKIVTDFTYNFKKGEKIGIVGENGCGKTTFLNMLLSKEPIDSGNLEIGQTVVFGYYTQEGISFDEKKRVIDVIKDIAEDISIGKDNKLSPTQFLNYFLFPPSMHYSYIYKLSGGEKRRLYLMTVLMNNPNFLILDEPTNDLDIMTLDVLEDYLEAFQGCVIIVSHDRYFMDKIVDHLFVFQEEGNIKDYPGNYSQYRDWYEKQLQNKVPVKKQVAKSKNENSLQEKRKLTYKEQQEYETLTQEINLLENEKKDISDKLSSGELTSDDIVQFSKRLSEIDNILPEKENRWLYLSEWV